MKNIRFLLLILVLLSHSAAAADESRADVSEEDSSATTQIDGLVAPLERHAFRILQARKVNHLRLTFRSEINYPFTTIDQTGDTMALTFLEFGEGVGKSDEERAKFLEKLSESHDLNRAVTELLLEEYELDIRPQRYALDVMELAYTYGKITISDGEQEWNRNRATISHASE